MKDDPILLGHAFWVDDNVVSVENAGIGGDAPRLVADDAFAVLTSRIRTVLVGMKKGSLLHD
jgi:hypothetical protein